LCLVALELTGSQPVLIQPPESLDKRCTTFRTPRASMRTDRGDGYKDCYVQLVR
jgi:hypothetical protein